MDEKLGFFLKKPQVSEAIARGITFEICYGRALTDSVKRRMLLNNSLSLCEISSCKNLIISSAATDWLAHRSVEDVRAMAVLLGVPSEKRNKVLCENCEHVINRAKSRSIFKGVVQVTTPSALKAALESQHKIVPSAFAQCNIQ